MKVYSNKLELLSVFSLIVSVGLCSIWSPEMLEWIISNPCTVISSFNCVQSYVYKPRPHMETAGEEHRI